jgi:hypothetical protein
LNGTMNDLNELNQAVGRQIRLDLSPEYKQQSPSTLRL